jgi:hypothetical protein
MASTTAHGAFDDCVLMMNPDFDVVNIQEFDILLTDIKAETIRGMEIDGVKHLSQASSADNQLPLNGVTYGDYTRVLVRALLTVKDISVNAIMLIDTSSPYTFLTAETFKALQVDLNDQSSDQAFIRMNMGNEQRCIYPRPTLRT